MQAGAAIREFTPLTSQFLAGYPHVSRMSEGVHDPLLSSALYLANAQQGVLLIANDIIFVPTDVVRRARESISAATGLPGEHILISATHTHSGPKVTESPWGQSDPDVPPVDAAFIDRMTTAITEAGIAAVQAAVPAQIGFGLADATGIGTNRHDPHGPADLTVPVVAARTRDGRRWIGVMWVCAMHPTVMHEDSRLVSADFPWATRQALRDLVGADCALLHHMGCAGNQSSRHVTRANTFAEAERIGGVLGNALVRTLGALPFSETVDIRSAVRQIDPPRRVFPDPRTARATLDTARRRFEKLKRTGPATEARTAECDVFGAEHKLALAERVASGDLEPVYQACTPAELQVIRLGDWFFAAWPSETYVEFALALREQSPHTYAISVANGRLPGYITTAEAAATEKYEAGAAFFAPETGDLYVSETATLVQSL